MLTERYELNEHVPGKGGEGAHSTSVGFISAADGDLRSALPRVVRRGRLSWCGGLTGVTDRGRAAPAAAAGCRLHRMCIAAKAAAKRTLLPLAVRETMMCTTSLPAGEGGGVVNNKDSRPDRAQSGFEVRSALHL